MAKVDALELIQEWWQGPPKRTRGDISGGLVLLEHLRKNFSLDINAHKADNSDQLKGATTLAVAKILERFGEKRPLSKEAGRTNCGLMTNLSNLLKLMKEYPMENLTPKRRDVALLEMQQFLAVKATGMIDAKKPPSMPFAYHQKMTSRAVIAAILEKAKERGNRGMVAKNLIGAKLALRFPGAVGSKVGEHGDFQIHDSIFHVSVSPHTEHYKKCTDNVARGLRVFLLVPDDEFAYARELMRMDEAVAKRVTVESVESFLSHSIGFNSAFSIDGEKSALKELLEEFNHRAAACGEMPLRIPSRLAA